MGSGELEMGSTYLAAAETIHLICPFAVIQATILEAEREVEEEDVDDDKL